MNNPTQPVVELEIGLNTYSLVFDFESLAEAEDLTGQPLLSGIMHAIISDNGSIERPRINFVRHLLFACLHSRHPDLTVEQVKDFVTVKNFYPVWAKVLESWRLAQVEETEGEADEANPTQDQS